MCYPIDERFAATIGIIGLTSVNLWLGQLVLKNIRAQKCIKLEGKNEYSKEYRKAIIGHCGFMLFIIAIGWYDQLLFEIFTRGFIIMLLICIGINIESVFFYRELALPGRAQGELTLSYAYRFRGVAHHLIAAGILLVGIYVMIPSPSLIGACLLIFSTAYGFLRKARLSKGPNG